ncbi:zinc-binding dehydrogenase [Lysobacter tyrosinilyticus]
MKAVVYREYGSPDALQLSKTSTAEDLATLAGLLEQRAFRPVIDRRYPLGDAVDAIRHLEKGHACGKIVVEI